MGRRHPNHRLVKIHFTYTVEQVASMFGVHKNTVRAWLRQGLPTIDQRRPALIHGPALVAFLRDRRERAKRSCSSGQIYCVKCRVPREPAGDMADYIPITATSGNLRGICPACDTIIHRRVSWAKLDQIRGRLEVTIPQAQLHIGDSRSLSVNCDFTEGA